MIDTLVVFGAGGDLTARLLLPAVAALHESGALGPDFRFVGSGEQAWTTAEFRARVGRDDLPLDYRQADVTDPAAVAAVLEGLGPSVVYLALPTRLMLGAVQAIRAFGLGAGQPYRGRETLWRRHRRRGDPQRGAGRTRYLPGSITCWP